MHGTTRHILTILREAKESKRPYPQTFEALKEAGITEYTVSWKSGYDAIYKGSFGDCHEPAPAGFKPVTIASQFSLDAVKQAVHNTQQKKTNFVEFLHEMGAAGVSHYHVDIEKRTVTYYNPTETEMYAEKVPAVS